MSKRSAIRAIFENGVLRPLNRVDLSEHQEVRIVILSEGEDIPAKTIAELGKSGNSFDFLAAPGEDIYSSQDGEPI